MNSRYTTVFDFLDAGYPAWPSIFGCMAVVAGIGLYIEREKMMPNRSPFKQKAIAVLFLAGALLWTGIISWRLFAEYRQLSDAVEHNRVRVAEGPVDSFTGFLDDGSLWEKFCVQGACFHYSSFIPSAGFQRTAKYGGPIHKGAYVRVLYTGNLIVRLETRN